MNTLLNDFETIQIRIATNHLTDWVLKICHLTDTLSNPCDTVFR